MIVSDRSKLLKIFLTFQHFFVKLETCHGECINSDHCVLGQASKDGKPTAVCNCKAGFSGEKCEKKVGDAKAVAETTQSTTGYIVAIVILSVVSVIALAGVGVLFWKSRR